MLPERWKEITGNIKDNFTVEDEGQSHVDDEGGVDIEFIEFQGPLGRMRLEYIIRPVVVNKKTTYSKRIGSETKVDYIYSQDEKQYILNVYKWDDGRDDWVEVEGEMFK